MSDTMKSVRYAFMDLRNIVRLFGRNKNKQVILGQIELTMHTLQQLKEEVSK